MTEMARRVAMLALVMALPAGVALGQAPVAAVRDGCFALTDATGAWVTWYIDSGAVGGDAVPRNAIIQLTAERKDAPYEVYFAWAARPTAPYRISWLPWAADSIRIVFSDGFSGVRFTLRVRGDSLDGVAQGMSDVVTIGAPPPRRDPRRGARLPCPREFTAR